MSNVKSESIKILREKTGAGIMDCKKALQETSGDIEQSVIWLRKKGISSANKKSSRTAAEGLVGVAIKGSIACILEVNSETDFVSKNKDFQHFINRVLAILVEKKVTLENLMHINYNEDTRIEDALKNLIAKIGENIVVRRLQYILSEGDNSFFVSYTHNKVDECLGKIGSIVLAKANNNNEKTKELAKKISMHISASRPLALKKELLNSEFISKEKDIIKGQLLDSGKPENIIDKIVEGKISKYVSEVTLLEQSWVMDTSLKVKDVINKFNEDNTEKFELIDYAFFVLGEGIDIVEKNFKEEVESQL